LRLSDYGCHSREEYVGCIVYADDILLLSAFLTQARVIQIAYKIYSSKTKKLFGWIELDI